MNNFKKYQNKITVFSKNLKLDNVLKHYALPNLDEVNSMICGYADERLFCDTELFDVAESIDYFKFEKELWRID